MSNEGTSNSRFLLRYADREIGRYLVVVPHTNVPDIHSLPPNCASSIEWHSRLSFNIQVLGKTTYFPQQSKQINQCRGLGTDFSWIRNVWRNKTISRLFKCQIKLLKGVSAFSPARLVSFQQFYIRATGKQKAAEKMPAQPRLLSKC